MYKVFGVKGACCKMCLVKKLSGDIIFLASLTEKTRAGFRSPPHR